MTLRGLIAAIFGLAPEDPRLDELEEESKRRSWAETPVVFEIPDEPDPQPVHARTTDTQAAQEYAAIGFDTAGQQTQILETLGREWLTCRELASLLYGPGPYPSLVASRVNKVWTNALELHRAGLLDRDDSGPRLRYRLPYPEAQRSDPIPSR